MTAVASRPTKTAVERLQRVKSDWRFASENLYSILYERSSEVQPIRFNEAQVRFDGECKWFEDRGLPVRLWILKARRAGLSTVVQCKTYHRVSTVENTRGLIVANQDGPARNILNISRQIWKRCKPQYRPPIPASLRNEPPKDKLEFETMNSGIYTATAESLNQFVSFGFKIVHVSEASRFKRGDALFASIFPTLHTDPTSMFFGESTALGQGNFFHEQCEQARKQQGRGGGEYGGFRLLFIPRQEMTLSYALPIVDDGERSRLRASLSKAEKELMAVYPQIGLEQIKWERAMRSGAPYNTDPEMFDQDYPTTFELAFLASGKTVFGRGTITKLSYEAETINPATGNKYSEPLFAGDIYWGDPKKAYGEKEHPYGPVRRPMLLTPGEAEARGYPSNVNEGWRNNLRVFAYPQKGDRLFIGGDVARGDPATEDGDFSTLVVLRKSDLGRDAVVMTWRGHINPVAFAELSSALAWYCRYLVGEDVPAPLLTIEWNGPGTSTNNTIDHFSLYDKTFRYFHPGVHKGKPSNHIGWESNGKTKPIMVDFLTRHVQKNLLHIPDKEIITEMSSYRRLGDYGDASDYGGVGAHDDLVTAIEIALVTLRRTEWNYEDSLSMGRSAEDSATSATGRTEAWDPFDRAEEQTITLGEMKLATASGMLDLEGILADGDWRGYDGESQGQRDSYAWDPWE